MPLLSLPFELLVEIIHEALATTSAIANCCDGEVRLPLSCISPNTTSLAHTCQLLRSITLPFMYAAVTARPDATPALHALLASHPHIAGYVRQLTLFPTNPLDAQLLHEILALCTRLQDLRIDGSHSTEEATTTLLTRLPHPHIALSLRRLPGNMILRYLSSAPHSVHTVRIEEHIKVDIIGPEREPAPALASSLPPGDLPNVQKLTFNTNVWHHTAFANSGRWLAETMQNVHVLDVHITREIFCLLGCYGKLGTRLTELTVHFRWMPVHVCETIAVLAPSLRKFVAHGGNVCHNLFDGDWGCVEEFEIVCDNGCDDTRVDVLRDRLLKLVCARPAVSVLVMVRGGEEMMRWSGGVGDVASVEAFGEMEEEWQCTFGLIE